ncbi:MAG: GrpB family protein [Mobilitalea sp.]
MCTIRTIIVVPYDENWIIEFKKIKDEVLSVICDDIISFEHIGSTSVPGLWAKPIIDINVIVENTKLPLVIEKLFSIGYLHEGNLGIEGREAFKYSDKPHLMQHNLYVSTKDSAEYKRHIAFRDYLRSHPLDCIKYSEIKIEMSKKFPHDIDSYIKGKEPVVREIYQKCGIPLK